MIPRKLVSLLEILRVHAEVFVEVSRNLWDSIRILDGDDIWKDDEHRIALLTRLRQLRTICTDSELPVTLALVNRIMRSFEINDDAKEADTTKELIRGNTTNALLKQYLYDTVHRFQDELSTKMFLQVPHSRMKRFDDPLDGWIEVAIHFPDVIGDIEEMQKCFALSRYSASMFHAMHVAEWCAIELGNHIGVIDPMKGWGPTTKQLDQLVRDGRSKFPGSLKVSFEFVEQLNQEVTTMKLAWRHKIDHAANTLIILPNADFTPDVAEHIIQSVKVFMQRIWEGLPKP